MDVLRMFYKDEDLVVTATRSVKSITQIAENMTIITAEEIEEMNAHTVTDVLNHITGIQIDPRGGLGSPASVSIQGSDFRHVLVMIDGIRLNNLSDFYSDIGAIPVQNIKRIEIIKGPASSVWGSSLGGVINIVTKAAGEGKPGGTLRSSYGEEATGDYRAELSGKAGSIGYYLSVGRLKTDGFNPNNSYENDNFYTKLRTDLSRDTYLTFTFGYRDGSRGMGQYEPGDWSFENDFSYLHSTLSLNSALSRNTDLEISLRALRQDNDLILNQLSTGDELQRDTYEDTTEGGSLKLISRQGSHTMVLGSDYDNGELKSNVITGEKHSLERQAFYANDTIKVGKFFITPGLRYDDISTSGDFVSPSLGATYSLRENHLFRIAVARGFNTPTLTATYGTGFFFNPNPNLEVEKVWSYLAGYEVLIPNSLRLKATLFRYDIEDAITDKPELDGTFTAVNTDEIRRQGIELEIETMPVYNLSLQAGYMYLDAENLETGKALEDIAEYTIDVGLKYDDKTSFMALLLGHYIWWNPGSSRNGKYNNFIWDLNVVKKVYKKDKTALEAFLNVHNLFDGSQYLSDIYKNPGRWVEAGLRLKF